MINERIEKAMFDSEPRYMRAKQFADIILHLLAEYLPQERQTRRRIHDYLLEQAYETNGAIINVPPEYDALKAHQIEMEMLKKVMVPLVVPAP